MKGIALLLLSAAMLLADVTGKWSGTAQVKDEEGQTHSLYFIFKQDGATLTGSGGPNEEEQHPMQNGTVEGDRLKFEVPAGKGVLYFDLKAAGDEINGDAQLKAEDHTANAKIALKRVAEK